MKKILSVFVVALLLVAFACGGGKYADVKKVMENTIAATEDFAAALEKAGSADDVVSAINGYTDTMKKIKPEMLELKKKYPELEKETETPEELKPTMEKLKQLTPKMMGAMAKIAQYVNDPKVQEAQKKLGEAMSGVN